MSKTKRYMRRKYGNKYQDHCIKLYKLHYEMADRVNDRKDQIHRLFVVLFSSLAGALAVSDRLNLPRELEDWIPVTLAIAGMLVAVVWLSSILVNVMIFTNRQRVLKEMEKVLPLQGIAMEEKIIGNDMTSYRNLVIAVEVALPVISLILFATLYALIKY